MEFIIEHWSTIAGVLVIVIGAIVSIIKFVKSGKAIQLANIEEWLVYATAIAEKELGGGTGQLKLRYVYDMFIAKFPTLSKIIKFEQFSKMVDKSLEHMKGMLESNKAVNNFVTGSDNKEEASN